MRDYRPPVDSSEFLVTMEINYLKVVLVTSFVAHSNVLHRVSYRGPCMEICIVSCNCLQFTETVWY